MIFDDEEEARYHERRTYLNEKLYPVVRAIYDPDVVCAPMDVVNMIIDSWGEIEEAMKL